MFCCRFLFLCPFTSLYFSVEKFRLQNRSKDLTKKRHVPCCICLSLSIIIIKLTFFTFKSIHIILVVSNHIFPDCPIYLVLKRTSPRGELFEILFHSLSKTADRQCPVHHQQRPSLSGRPVDWFSVRTVVTQQSISHGQRHL